MTAANVAMPIITGTGGSANSLFYSSDGTLAGNTQPTVVSFDLGFVTDTPAANGSANSTAIALLKAMTTAVQNTSPVSITQTSVAYNGANTITRPANVTAYSALDVVGGAFDLGVCGPVSGTIFITSVELEADIAAIPSGQTSWVLHLYNVTPPSAIADNGAFDIGSGDRASHLTSIPINTLIDYGSTLYCKTNNLNDPVLLGTTPHLFGYLETMGGFTPAANSEVYKVSVHTVAV